MEDRQGILGGRSHWESKVRGETESVGDGRTGREKMAERRGRGGEVCYWMEGVNWRVSGGERRKVQERVGEEARKGQGTERETG